MILVDTSVWVDHFRRSNDQLISLLDAGQVLTHPFVIGELALGSLRQRRVILQSLQDLPQATHAADTEVLAFIERYEIAGMGIGYIDIHLLVSAILTSARLWTRDKRLLKVLQDTVQDRYGLSDNR